MPLSNDDMDIMFKDDEVGFLKSKLSGLNEQERDYLLFRSSDECTSNANNFAFQLTEKKAKL